MGQFPDVTHWFPVKNTEGDWSVVQLVQFDGETLQVAHGLVHIVHILLIEVYPDKQLFIHIDPCR